jgi:hypothetical protein
MSNNPYKRTSKVDVIGDLPGADQARNLLRIGHVAQDVTLETKLYEAVDSNGDPSVRVEPTSGSFDVKQADPVALEGDDGAGTYGEVYRRGNALRASLEADEVGLASESTLSSVDSGVGNLEGALQANANDNLRVYITSESADLASESTLSSTLAVEQQSPVKIEGGDDDGNTHLVNSETLNQGITGASGLVTYVARALQDQGYDQLRVDIENEAADLATETTLSSANASLGNLTDALQTRSNDEVRVQVAGSEAIENGTGLASGASISNSLGVPGAESVSGVVTRASTSYDVDLEWTDGAGTVIQTESIVAAAGGGVQTTFDVPARAENCNVVVSDAGGASGAVDLTVHMR